MLRECPEPLVHRYPLLMLDLDGVVYRGPHRVPEVDQHLAAARTSGARLAFVTNNAARGPAQVAAHLTGLGVPAQPEDVVTSAQAVASMVAAALSPGAPVLVLGSQALADEVAAAGLCPVLVGSPDWSEVRAQAVVSGFAPDLVWRDLIRAAVLIRDGLPWWAANTDLTFPADFGLAPGHGALVRMLSEYSGVHPRVAGKPEPQLLRETMTRCGTTRALMVGDRLDTDIAAGRRAEVATLLVMTGVSDLATVLRAAPQERPDHVLDTLAGLADPHVLPQRDGVHFRHGPWQAELAGADLKIRAVEDIDDRACSGHWDRWWQLVCTAAWTHLDSTGELVRVLGPVPPGQRR